MEGFPSKGEDEQSSIQKPTENTVSQPPLIATTVLDPDFFLGFEWECLILTKANVFWVDFFVRDTCLAENMLWRVDKQQSGGEAGSVLLTEARQKMTEKCTPTSTLHFILL